MCRLVVGDQQDLGDLFGTVDREVLVTGVSAWSAEVRHRVDRLTAQHHAFLVDRAGVDRRVASQRVPLEAEVEVDLVAFLRHLRMRFPAPAGHLGGDADGSLLGVHDVHPHTRLTALRGRVGAAPQESAAGQAEHRQRRTGSGDHPCDDHSGDLPSGGTGSLRRTDVRCTCGGPRTAAAAGRRSQRHLSVPSIRHPASEPPASPSPCRSSSGSRRGPTAGVPGAVPGCGGW